MSAEVLTQAIDPASDRAVYKQIADHLRETISRGRLKEGDQLPSEAQLIGHYGVARMTIRSALRLLEAEGLITAEHGRGVTCAPGRRCGGWPQTGAQRHRKEGKAAFIAESGAGRRDPPRWTCSR
jgi:GntR family transcriptional regulator